MGNVSFAGLALLTAPGLVMTPRRASEQLVAAACARVAGRRASVADVGTGSGAIAIAVAKACPEVEVWATDANGYAVGLARANARLHGLHDRLLVRHGDLLEPVPGTFDVIVANLPYVPAAAASRYPDLRTQPFDAVFTHGDGLNPYRRLVDAASTRLAEEGILLVQLHRRVLRAVRGELPALRASLEGWARWQCAGGRR